MRDTDEETWIGWLDFIIITFSKALGKKSLLLRKSTKNGVILDLVLDASI